LWPKRLFKKTLQNCFVVLRVAFIKHFEKQSDNSKSFKEAGKMQNGKTVGNKEARRKDEEERMTAIDI
jgi:hypothetical protein